jgi:hypothetical protein
MWREMGNLVEKLMFRRSSVIRQGALREAWRLKTDQNAWSTKDEWAYEELRSSSLSLSPYIYEEKAEPFFTRGFGARVFW